MTKSAHQRTRARRLTLLGLLVALVLACIAILRALPSPPLAAPSSGPGTLAPVPVAEVEDAASRVARNPLPPTADRAAPAPHCCRIVATVVDASDQGPIAGARMSATWYRADAWTVHAGATGIAGDDAPIEAVCDAGGHVGVDVDAHHRGRWRIQVSHPEREENGPRDVMIPADTASFDLGQIGRAHV